MWALHYRGEGHGFNSGKTQAVIFLDQCQKPDTEAWGIPGMELVSCTEIDDDLLPHSWPLEEYFYA